MNLYQPETVEEAVAWCQAHGADVKFGDLVEVSMGIRCGYGYAPSLVEAVCECIRSAWAQNEVHYEAPEPCPAVDPDDGRRCALPGGHSEPHKHEEDARG